MKRQLKRSIVVLAVVLPCFAGVSVAQQKIGYVDSEYILGRTPEYTTIQQQLDRMAQEWQQELEERQDEVDEMFREYQARELLYTNEERQRKREEIMRTEEEVERLRMQYFGPEGDLFTQQERLMRPIQERVLVAIEEVATRDDYDYVFDKGGDYLFMFAREEFDLSDDVLSELGIEVEQTNGQGAR